ncbi:hypothetical protein ACFPVX_24200 [Cohnella faecalis]|uniref:Uncharacterized protein n=1 Tax=Cohnella faecalis TaxID=2315694 RepID=A0A398CS80_9BACL|nr:hypothetical protein [Cohnella faecalis]RIE02657.1 hypothetical protein D3H35_18435 [Cohnella faecalis]
MTESELMQIRKFVHLTCLIKVAINTINDLSESRISFKSMPISITKLFGKRIRNDLKELQKEMRANVVHAWLEDNGEDVVYVHTSIKGVNGRHGIKRKILNEDLQDKIEDYANQFGKMSIDSPYVLDPGGCP